MNERDALRLRHILDAAQRIVWQTATESIPAFAGQIRRLLEAGR